ncbi:hypothetical protein BDFB_011458 [Asbolus verrucosus]|uniref:Uncharacterized protein n=1 Tax=Asbolus verrucosus TaxID=1661398 RepID=A0A482W6W5_ASBVE|nr:hypothetical protein BDFB_011458 [Asbolus verrucosus]
MIHLIEQKAFLTYSCSCNGRKINVLNIAVDYKQCQDCLDRTMKLFRQIGSIKRKEDSGRPTKRIPKAVNAVTFKIPLILCQFC